MYRVIILTISDTCSKGEKEDISGKVIKDIVQKVPFEIIGYEIIPDESDMIKTKLIECCDGNKADLILTTGGTGFTERDNTPEATRAVVEKEVPGIPEAMRVLCLTSSKRAMLSRGIAGIRKRTLIVNLPGSSRGAKESLEAVVDTLQHGLDMIAGKPH